jgi:hypothetical protein
MMMWRVLPWTICPIGSSDVVQRGPHHRTYRAGREGKKLRFVDRRKRANDFKEPCDQSPSGAANSYGVERVGKGLSVAISASDDLDYGMATFCRQVSHPL